MSDTRPDPDALLARVRANEERQARGKLKVFFGASPGVGKTYAMLSEARDRKKAGEDVVVGVVETHGRADTEALTDGFEMLPRRAITYRGITLREFDLDAALVRRPQVILVDELAHTNAEGSRHRKRWQDVQELLSAGIEVYTTVNVQHIESLNDVVAQITGVIVRETVPDSLIEQADDIELIDIPPDELLQRISDGKVYIPRQAERATENFFRKGNLIALRELALRRTADRVDAQMQDYRQDKAIAEPWPTNERLLVCIGPNADSTRLVRIARRMASRMRAEWIVLYVELPSHLRLPEPDREYVTHAIRLAEQLGAEVVSRSGTRPSDEILSYARTRNITKIIVGKPERPRWKDLLYGSVVDDLIRHNGIIDVYVMSGEASEPDPISTVGFQPTSTTGAYGWATVVVVLCLVVAALTAPIFDLANLVMIFLLGVLFVASRLGRGPSVLASVLSVAAFDYFFVPPQLTFTVADVQYVWTLATMLAIGLVISTLTVQLRQRADAANLRERRTAALYTLSSEFANQQQLPDILRTTVQRVSETFDAQVVVALPTTNNRLQPWGKLGGWWGNNVSDRMLFAPDTTEMGVAQWVYDHGEIAGTGTNTLPSATALYLPLNAARGRIGVLGVRPNDPRSLQVPEQRRLLEAFVNQIAGAIERTYLADEARQAQVQIETERMRASLLSMVSHDLRTPLATITGASSSLIEGSKSLSDEARADLAHAIYSESNRLSRLVSNLLDMTKIEAGAIRVAKEWQPIEEVVGAALTRLDSQLHNRDVEVAIPPSMPLVPIDGVLIEQVLVNLLENALRYTPATAAISITASVRANDIVLAVADRGPGLPTGEESRVFEKFHRVANDSQGSGLGLAICRGIVEAHGGRIWAEQRPSGGAIFQFTLPLEGQPPSMPQFEPLQSEGIAG